MPLYQLHPHRDHPPLRVARVDVQVQRPTIDALRLTYTVAGAGALLIPGPCPPARADGLWRTTCCELFLKPPGGRSYREFNFSPSGQWAAYGFDDYRAGMRDLELEPPAIHAEATADRFRMTVDLRPAMGAAGDAAMALTAVLEERGGAKSFWALAHPIGAPDFHHPDCFAARLPAPGAL